MNGPNKSRWMDAGRWYVKVWPAERLNVGQRAIIVSEDNVTWMVEEAWDAAAIAKVAKEICQEAMEKGTRWVAYGDDTTRFKYGGRFCRHLRPGEEKIATECKQVLQRGGAMIVAVHPPEQQCAQRIAVHGAVKVTCSLCEERGETGKMDDTLTESPGISRTQTPVCRMGAVVKEKRDTRDTGREPKAGMEERLIDKEQVKYPEHEYAAIVPPEAPRQKRTQMSGEARKSVQELIKEATYDWRETSADEGDALPQEAYVKYVTAQASKTLNNGRTTPKVILNRNDTPADISAGSHIEELQNGFFRNEGRREKIESITSFSPTDQSVTASQEYEMKRLIRNMSQEATQAEEERMEMVDLTALGDTDDASSESSEDTVVFRTPRAAPQQRMHHRSNSWSGTPNKQEVDLTQDLETVVSETDRAEGRYLQQESEPGRIAIQYAMPARKEQAEIFLHLLARQQYKLGSPGKIASAIRNLREVGVTSGPGTTNGKKLEAMVEEAIREDQEEQVQSSGDMLRMEKKLEDLRQEWEEECMIRTQEMEEIRVFMEACRDGKRGSSRNRIRPEVDSRRKLVHSEKKKQ